MTRAYDVNNLNAGQLVECMTLALAIGNLALPANTTIVRADKELCTRHSSQGLFFGKLVHEKKEIPLHSVPINKGMPSVPMQGPVSLKLMKATPFEEAHIRLSLIELRRSKGVTMTGIEKWSLYYSIAQSINVAPTTLQPVVDRTLSTLSTSSSNTSLDNLIAAADERLGSP